MLKRAQNQIIFIILFYTLLFLSGFYYFNILEKNRFNAIVDEEFRSQKLLLENGIKLESKNFETYVFDNTFWDDMVNFTKTNDEKWAKENFEENADKFNFQSVWVFDSIVNQVYTFNNLNNSELKIFFLSGIELKKFVSEKPFSHFFVRTRNGIMEIFGAPINPSSDFKRVTVPKGYFFEGRLWSEKYLKYLSSIINVSIEVKFDELNINPTENSDNIVLKSQITLKNWNDKTVAYAVGTKTSDLLNLSLKSHKRQFILMYIFIGILLLLTSLFLVISVNRPLKQINLSIAKNDLRYLEKLSNKRSEFGSIAKLIKSFFSQKQNLINEIKEKEIAQRNLQESQELLEYRVEQRSKELLETYTALKESEERYRKLFEYNPEGIAIHSEGKIVYVNNAIVDMFKAKDKSDIIGKPVFDFVHPAYKKIVLERIKKSHEENQMSELLEEKMIRLDGEVIDVEVVSIPFIMDGKPGAEVVIRDITDRKHIEKSRASTYKISKLVHSSVSLNELFTSIHNIISELMPAKNLYIAMFDEEKNELSFPYFVDEFDEKPLPKKPGKGLTEYVLRTGKALLATPSKFEELTQSGDVESIGAESIDWLGAPLKANGKTIGVIVVQSYSSGVRYCEQEMNILNFVSEQIAMSISSKRSEEELFKAKEKAEESSRLKSSLLTNISHELRTPLNGIIGFAGFLESDFKDEEIKEIAGNILQSGKRLMKTLNSIMEYSELESGKQNITFTDFNIKSEIDDVIKSFLPVINQKNLFLNSFIPDNIKIFSDIFLFQSIISNLIDNAVKFTSKGGITIKVDSEFDKGKNIIIVKVTDTGIGIAKKDQEIIFKEFRQVSEGQNRIYDGSGLGLTLILKMVKLLKGNIELSSEKDKGSTFIVRIPSEKFIVNNNI